MTREPEPGGAGTVGAPLRAQAREATVSGLRRQDAIAGALFVLPLAIGLLVFEFGPFIATVGLSFFVWDVVRPPQWTGLDNFGRLFTADPLYWIAVRNTLVYTVGTVVPGFFLSLLLAVALNQKLRGSSIYRTLFQLRLQRRWVHYQ
ncbi:MAG TPA: sugar ABC transporter permease [Chloroflexota bacterium]|jgi:multiple sugar transport system permease protein